MDPILDMINHRSTIQWFPASLVPFPLERVIKGQTFLYFNILLPVSHS